MKKVLQQTLFRLKTFLLLAVMFIVGSSAAWAQETFDFSSSKGTKTQNGITVNQQFTTLFGNPEIYYTDPSTNYMSISVEDGMVITKVEFVVTYTYDYGELTVLEGTNSNGSSVGTWDQYNFIWQASDGDAVKELFMYKNGGSLDIMFNKVKVWVESASDGGTDDGSVKSTFNFNQASVPFVNAAGVAGNLQGGNRPSIGDVFTAPSGGATLTFNYVGESWSNSAQRLRLDSNASFTIAAPEGFEMTKIVFTTDINTMTFTSKSGLTGNGSAKATWEGQSESETFTISALSFIQNIKVTMVPVAEEGEITYTIDLVDAPVGAYVTLDGETFDSDDTYTVEKNFGKNDLEAYEPEGYYAEVEYTRDNHTYTVTYHAYNYYDVTVTGTTDPAAGVVYNETTYHNSDRIETKDVLTASSVEAAEVANMKGTVSMTGNTYSVDYQEKLDFVIMTNTGQTSYYNSEYDVTVTCLATWSSCLNFWRSADLTVESSTFLISRVEFEELYGATISGTSSYGNISNNVWEGTPSNSITFSTTSGDYRVKKLHIYLARPQVSTYTINLVDAPAGASVLVNNEKTVTTASDTYSTTAVLNENNVVVTCPETHYYEKAYDEDTHTFTVTFNEYYHYAVSVTGCTEATAGVRVNGYGTYRNEETVQVKEPLADSDVEAVVVNGYEAAAPVVGTLDGHNATISVVYAEASEIDYTVTITGMPDGASVMIEDEEFFASGTHKSRMTLDAYDASVKNCPETHYTNEQYEWYDEDSQTFNITFSEYLAYTIAVDEASAYTGAEAGVKVYNSYTYLLGQTIYNKTALTENDVKAADVDGYTGTVTLSGDVFTVSYAKNEFITFDANKFSVGDWGTGSLDNTIDNVRIQAWDSGDYFAVNGQDASHIVLTSSVAPIEKVELEYVSWGRPSYGYDIVDSYNLGNDISTTNDITTWTGSTKSLELWQSNSTAYVSLIKVYLAQPTTYHVNITGMPAEGATVVVNNDYVNGYYTEDGNYDYVTYDELNASSVWADCPESHQVEKNYDASTNTFSVNYTALPTYDYTFAVEPYEDTNLKIYIDGKPYGDGADYYTFYRELTLEDIETPEYEGYYANPSVKIEDLGPAYLVTVIYTPLPAIAISDKAQDKDGNYWTTFSIDKPISLAEGFTPCIVTAAENGVLTVQEFVSVDNQATTTLDFMNGTVFENASRLFDESGNAADVTVVRNGGRIESQYLGLYYSSNPTLTITSNSSEPISKIIVSPWGFGSGYCCSFNGGAVVDVPNDPYTFDVNATSCTLAFTPRAGSSIYVTKIEIVVGEKSIPVIPANTGILVKSSEAISKIPYTIHADDAETVAVNGNLLVAGCDPEAVWEDANKLFYKLSWKNSNYEDLGFYWGVAGGHSITPSKNKAYLVLDAPAEGGASNRAAYLFGGEEGTLTGIVGVESDVMTDAPIYNLQGKRVVAPKAGVYVKNGKKYIVK